MTIGEKLLKLHDELMQKGQTDMASTIAGAIIAIDTSIATMVLLTGSRDIEELKKMRKLINSCSNVLPLEQKLITITCTNTLLLLLGEKEGGNG